jgi:hypothetical protein
MVDTTIQNTTLIKVNLKDNFVWLWYGIVKDVPKLQDKIRKLEDGTYTCNLSINETELWYVFQRYVEGVAPDLIKLNEMQEILLQLKLGILDYKDVVEKYKNMPCTIPMIKDNIGCGGAFVDLASEYEVSYCLKKLLPALSTDKYISHFISPDKEQNSAFASIYLSHDGRGRLGDTQTFHLNRTGDIVTHTVLKIVTPVLPHGLRWKSNIYSKMIKSFSLKANEITLFTRSGSDNLTDIESLDLWPKYINCYNMLTLKEQNEASQFPMYIIMPLMLPWNQSKINTFPIVSVPFNDMKIEISYCDPSTIIDGAITPEISSHVSSLISEIECDYMVVSNKDRANMGKMPTTISPQKVTEYTQKDGTKQSSFLLDKMQEKTPEAKEKDNNIGSPGCVEDALPTLPGKLLPMVQHCISTHKFTNGNKIIDINLHAHHRISGLVLNFSSNILEDLPQKSIIYPFKYIELRYGHSTIRWSIHAADARDYLWRKCGRKPPKSQHSFLLPFSPEMFNFKEYPVGPELEKIDDVSLRIYGNELWDDTDWNLEISGLVTNIVSYCGGSCSF